MELGEAAERVLREPSGDQAAAHPQSSSTSLPPVSAEDIMIKLRRSADLLLGLGSGALTDESSGLGNWQIPSAVIQVKFFQVSPDTVALSYRFYLTGQPGPH